MLRMEMSDPYSGNIVKVAPTTPHIQLFYIILLEPVYVLLFQKNDCYMTPTLKV